MYDVEKEINAIRDRNEDGIVIYYVMKLIESNQ